MDFNKKLQYLLTKKNLSQTEFAKIINKKKQNVSRWLSGKFVPSAKNINKIAKALNVPVEELLSEEEYSKDEILKLKKDLKEKAEIIKSLESRMSIVEKKIKTRKK
ncbi:MAG: helix-turn-helix transcriptional regulator [Elusimicrobia bacterium]|nr:helix-turn-helix transcriptional regulator [Elusimicrobiota bacterium]